MGLHAQACALLALAPRAQEAGAFLRSALELSPTDLTARELFAQVDAQAVNQPATQTPEYYLDLSLQHYREERYANRSPRAEQHSHCGQITRSWNNICAA